MMECGSMRADTNFFGDYEFHKGCTIKIHKTEKI